MLSPLELENKRILTNKRKYDKLEMDEYLDMVFENYKALFNENEELKKQIKTLTEGIQYYRSIESTMQKALVLAEKTSKETKDAAALKAESIEKDANNRAAQIIGTAEAEYTRIREKCLALVQQFNHYKAQLQVAANEQLRLITSATFEVETPEIENQPASETVNAGTGMEQISAPEPESFSVPVTEPQPESFGIPTPEPQPESFGVPTPEPQPEAFGITAPEPEMESSSALPHIDSSEDKQKSSVYSFSSAGNTQPLPDLSLFKPDVASFDPPKPSDQPVQTLQSEPEPQPVEIQPPFQQPTVQSAAASPKPTPTETDLTQGFTFDNAPVPDKTMVLPDVKSVDREVLRGNKPTLTEEMLSAETINLEDSIREVRGQETAPLEVPKREEPQVLQIEPEPIAQPAQAQGLDSILQNITIGKKKKNNNGGDTQEDPFEFLGSVDDF